MTALICFSLTAEVVAIAAIISDMCLSDFLSSIHSVFISNLQKEIEKQTGYRSSRKRRSESQYDYEVYHSLEEVDVKPTIYPARLPACLSLSSLLSNLMHAQSKQTRFSEALSNSQLPHSTGLSPTAPRSLSHTETTLHSFRVFIFPNSGSCLMNLPGPMRQHEFNTHKSLVL